MFNRKNPPAPQPEEPIKADGKGRPTPTRKEAEAAAKQRAKSVSDPKSRSREQRAAQAARVREGMRTGDDRYLRARDQGPVKRFVRDWVDARVSFLEFIIFFAMIGMALGFSGTKQSSVLAGYVDLLIILIVVVEGGWVSFRLGSAVRTKFPGESTRGLTLYALTRSIYPRFLRMPKTQVGWGGRPKNR